MGTHCKGEMECGASTPGHHAAAGTRRGNDTITRSASKATKALRCVLSWLILALALFGVAAAQAQQRVAPIVGPFEYGYNRCEVAQFGYFDEETAASTGANQYYNTGCGAPTYQGVWGTVEQPNYGACGSDSRYPTFYLGVENQNVRDLSVTYTFSPPSCLSSSQDGLTVYRRRAVECPAGYVGDGATNTCVLPAGTPDPTKNNDPCKAGCNGSNPVHSALGYKLQREVDFSGNGTLLGFARYYNSSQQWSPWVLGRQWQSNFDLRITKVSTEGATTATAYRGNGDKFYFSHDATGHWKADPDVTLSLLEIFDAQGKTIGWTVESDQGVTEEYGAEGQLTRISDRDGHTLDMAYTNGLLAQVTDENGRNLAFTYGTVPIGSGDSAIRLTKMVSSGGLVVTYVYDSADSPYQQYRGMLKQVVYTSTLDANYSATRTYVYGEGDNANPLLLTGITDENGKRSASWRYDANGRAILSVHGTSDADADRVELTYAADGSTDVKNYLGSATAPAVRTLKFQTIFGVTHLVGSTGSTPAGGTASPSGPPTLPVSSTFDANGFPDHVVDANGVTTDHDYNALGLETKLTEAVGTPVQRTTETVWDGGLRLPLSRVVRDNAGVAVNQKLWTYNARGQVLATCESDPRSVQQASCPATGAVANGVRRWTYSYCDAVDAAQCPLVGLLLSSKNPRTDVNATKTYTYFMTTDESGCGSIGLSCHRLGDLKTTTNELGQVTTNFAYSRLGKVARTKDANGTFTDYTYTPRGALARKIIRANASGAASSSDMSVTLAYDNAGNVVSTTDGDGVQLTYAYDDAHRLTSVKAQDGSLMRVTLNAAGSRTKLEFVDAAGVVRSSKGWVYSALGQVISTLNGDGVSVNGAAFADSFDAAGKPVHGQDGFGTQTTRAYDALGRLSSVVNDAAGTAASTAHATTGFKYDTLDQVSSVTDPLGQVVTTTFDGLGNLLKQVSPDTGASVFSYDAMGNVTARTLATGGAQAVTYDALDRPLAQTGTHAKSNVPFEYDLANATSGCATSYPIGRLVRATRDGTTTTWCYDRFGNVSSRTQKTDTGTTYAVSYEWSPGGRVKTMTYPSGSKVAYTYDAQGNTSAISVRKPGSTTLDPVVAQAKYLPFGPASSFQLNGRAVTMTYDKSYQSTGVQSPAYTLTSTLGVDGQISSMTETVGGLASSAALSYDAARRMTKDVTGTVTHASLTYSLGGDRQSKAGDGVMTGTYAYLTGTRTLSSVGGFSRSKDAGGATTGLTSGQGAYVFTYDDDHRLIQASKDGQVVGSYRYDGLGLRVRKSATVPVAGVDRTFVHDEAGLVLGEYGDVTRDYIWWDGVPVATVDTVSGVGTVTYLIADGTGTPRAAVNATGSLVWSWAAVGNGFGESLPKSAGGSTYVLPLRFAGQYFDAETGLHHNNHRTYEPATGRFLETDPLAQVGGESPFDYAGNSPLMRTDALGLCWSNARAVAHFFAGGGDVTLGQIGCDGQVEGMIHPLREQWKSMTEAAMKGFAKGIHCNDSSPYDALRSVGARSGVFWIGGVSLHQDAKCQVQHTCPQGDNRCMAEKYNYHCVLTSSIHDLFENPSDFNNSAGKPNSDFWDTWNYGGTTFYVDGWWQDELSGGGQL